MDVFRLATYRRATLRILPIGLCFAVTVVVRAEEPASVRSSAAALSAQIDSLLADDWASQQITPAPPATDAEFFRRASLDLSGRIPAVADVRRFLSDDSTNKREAAIDRWLASPAYVHHFARVWRSVLLTQASAQDLRFAGTQLEAWLRTKLRENVPYDAMVREILTTPLGDRIATAASDRETPTPLAFYQANELKAENLASAASRVFLGVNLECAQCHNHPFASWKQDQFWQFAGFFAGVQRLRPDNAFAPAPELLDRHSMSIPGTDRTVEAGFLDNVEPQWSSGDPPRVVLARWMTSVGNPYFARATVNGIWSQFFGRGIVDPLDELGGNTQPSHPALLDALAAEFVASGYDLKFLIRGIVGSQAYQRSSQLTDPSQRDQSSFARALARGLTPEQLFDSFVFATGCDDKHRSEMLTKFASLERPVETQRSILQALAMMNGQLVSEASSPTNSRTLAAVVEAPFLDRQGKLEALFLATLSREPSPTELQQCSSYIEHAAKASPPTDRDAPENEALADVFWALLNSAEFTLNH